MAANRPTTHDETERLYLILWRNFGRGAILKAQLTGKRAPASFRLSAGAVIVDTILGAVSELESLGLLIPCYETVTVGPDGFAANSTISDKRTAAVPPTHYRIK